MRVQGRFTRDTRNVRVCQGKINWLYSGRKKDDQKEMFKMIQVFDTAIERMFPLVGKRKTRRQIRMSSRNPIEDSDKTSVFKDW